jgi:hypothetical protein
MRVEIFLRLGFRVNVTNRFSSSMKLRTDELVCSKQGAHSYICESVRLAEKPFKWKHVSSYLPGVPVTRRNGQLPKSQPENKRTIFGKFSFWRLTFDHFSPYCWVSLTKGEGFIPLAPGVDTITILSVSWWVALLWTIQSIALGAYSLHQLGLTCRFDSRR